MWSRHCPSRKSNPRRIPSRVNPAFSSERCPARFAGLGAGFDAVELRVREQVAHELPLRLRAEAVPARLRQQDHADVPAVGVRAGPRAMPRNEPERAFVERGDEHAVVGGQHAVFAPEPPDVAGVVPAEPLVLADRLRVVGQRLQQTEVGLAHRAESHWAVVHRRSVPGAAAGPGSPDGDRGHPAVSFLAGSGPATGHSGVSSLQWEPTLPRRGLLSDRAPGERRGTKPCRAA